ncbi:MAG: response regulator [Anaerolineaceae bacterium]|nr:response regulator [Anaerolineaceae bacterium]
MSSTTPTVLYVEDDPASREVMVLVLSEMMGCTEYHMFEHSEDFMSRVKALIPQPDIILLDIHLKPFNGFEMLKMLRSDGAYLHTPVVALTASVMNEEVQQLQNAGFNAVFAKPIDIDLFPNKLTRILQGESILYITD